METLALQVHLTTVVCLIALVVATDTLGLLWVLGKKETLSLRLLETLHRLVWLGLMTMLLSGATMFLSYKDYLLTVPAFFVKIGFITALVVNAVVIGRHLHIPSERSFISLSPRERVPLYVSGAVSTISWVGAILAARMLGL